MLYVLQQSLNALQLGSIYALIALGYTLVYSILRMINFAHGDLFMVGAFVCFAAASYLKLPFIPPELREGHGEIELAERNALPKLVEQADLRGILHSHTTASDGTGRSDSADTRAAATARSAAESLRR